MTVSDTPNYARTNDSTRASVTMEVIFASGGFKNVYKGTYTEGTRKGQYCVCKLFKSGSVFEDSYFASELKIVAKTQDIVNRYNEANLIDRRIWCNTPAVWVFTPESGRSGEMTLIEPLIENFEKFNSNTGWTPTQTSPWIDVMQALSHFSYHYTNRQLTLCDLQGGVYKDGFVITDPVIMSNSSTYGPTDLGPEGISTFFAHHVCNAYCQKNWLMPQDRRVYFKKQEGSAMVNNHAPTRVSRGPLTQHTNSAQDMRDRFRNLGLVEEDEEDW